MIPTAEPLRSLHLLIVDSHNVDMTLGNILGRKPNPNERLRFDVLAEWFADRAGAESAEACYFINVVQERAADIRPWVNALRENGFWVFAKPKVADSDVDAEMVAHIERRHQDPGLAEVVVASGDQDNFRVTLEGLSQVGVSTAVLGFAEMAPWATMTPAVGFIDLRDIPGLFLTEIPREPSLDRLPPEGTWLRPFAPLGHPRSTGEGRIADGADASSDRTELASPA